MTINMQAQLGATDQQSIDFAVAAQEMSRQIDLARTLQSVLAQTVQSFPCDAVSVMLLKPGGKTEHVAASGLGAERADKLQIECGEGPSLDCMARGQDAVVDDLRFDSRWRFWAPQAANIGFRSALSVALSEDSTFGALTLYSRHSYFFAVCDLVAVEAFARHASIAVANVRERELLLQVREARHLLGQAQGILMERYDIDAQKAFSILDRYSEHKDIPLGQVAQHMVEHRRLPQVDEGSTAAKVA